MQHRDRKTRGQPGPAPGTSGAGDAQPSLAGALHGLQRTAGNRAVEAILAAGGSRDAASTGVHAIVPGIGTIPLDSFQFTPVRPTGRDPEETPKEGELPGGEMYFSSRMGPHSTLLARASFEGETRDVEVIVPTAKGRMRLVLKGAIISSYSVGSGTADAVESWSLDFESMTQSFEGDADE
ncbi:MAG: hypothetical protein ACRDZZ_00405 [Ilumatobacteraceae bacterium]